MDPRTSCVRRPHKTAETLSSRDFFPQRLKPVLVQTAYAALKAPLFHTNPASANAQLFFRAAFPRAQTYLLWFRFSFLDCRRLIPALQSLQDAGSHGNSEGWLAKVAEKTSGGTMKRVMITMMLLASVAVAQTLPAGTALKVKLENNLTTFSNKAGDPFSGRVTEAVTLGGKTVIPIGTTVQGRVTKINEPRRIAGKPTIGMFPETIVLPNGERYMLNAAVVDTNLRNGTDVNTEGQFKGAGHDGKDLSEIGFGTGGGMLVGGLIGGGKGLLVGGTIGATATVAHWLGKRRSAMLPAGTELVMELSRPLAMTAASGGQ